jgi:DNA polymerase-3 subunit epsilon
MHLNLKRPIAFFDIEATGLNITKDRIVEIAIIKVNPDKSEETYSIRLNPKIEIPAEVSEIHGIYQKDIENAPTFEDVAEKISQFIADADLAGYNSNKFDIPMLAEEFARAGFETILENKKFVDVQNIFHKKEQRTLSAAYAFYCKGELENAHNAFVDTRATLDVLLKQLEKYDDLQNDIDFLADFSKGGNLNLVDFAGRLARDEKGNVVYNFGKHKNKSVANVTKEEPGYYGWFISDSTDFPAYTKMKLKEEMNRIKAEIPVEQKSVEKQKKEAGPIDLNQLEALKAKFGK